MDRRSRLSYATDRFNVCWFRHPLSDNNREIFTKWKSKRNFSQIVSLYLCSNALGSTRSSWRKYCVQQRDNDINFMANNGKQPALHGSEYDYIYIIYIHLASVYYLYLPSFHSIFLFSSFCRQQFVVTCHYTSQHSGVPVHPVVRPFAHSSANRLSNLFASLFLAWPPILSYLWEFLIHCCIPDWTIHICIFILFSFSFLLSLPFLRIYTMASLFISRGNHIQNKAIVLFGVVRYCDDGVRGRWITFVHKQIQFRCCVHNRAYIVMGAQQRQRQWQSNVVLIENIIVGQWMVAGVGYDQNVHME